VDNPIFEDNIFTIDYPIHIKIYGKEEFYNCSSLRLVRIFYVRKSDIVIIGNISLEMYFCQFIRKKRIW